MPYPRADPPPRGRAGIAAACTAASLRATRARGQRRGASSRRKRACATTRSGAPPSRATNLRRGPRSANVDNEAALATITANGFSSRALRARSRATASPLRASQARWNPPRPLIATISPWRNRASVSAMGSTQPIARPARVDEAELRPAPGARVGLRVKTAMQRIAILGSAFATLPERCHAGHRPVVRQRARDRIARTAVGAVDERVTIATIAGIEELGEAIGADRAVRADRGGGVTAHALPNREAGLGAQRAIMLGDTVDPGERRRVAGKTPLHLVDARRSPSTSIVTPAPSLFTQPASASSCASR